MRPTPETPETGLPGPATDPPTDPASSAVPETPVAPPEAGASAAPAAVPEPAKVEPSPGVTAEGTNTGTPGDAGTPPPLPPAAESAPALCPRCGAAGADAGARFCPYDGSPLAAPVAARVCTFCGRKAADEEKFCALDGHAIGTAVKAGGLTGRVDRAAGFFDRAGHKADEVMRNGYAVHIGRYLGRAWDYFKDYPLGYLGYGAILALTALTGVGLLFIFPLAAGASWVARKQRRGEPVNFSDFFHGFNRFAPLFVGGLLSLLFMVLGIFTCGILTVYLAVAYMFFVDLVLFKGADFGEALENSRKIIHKQWFEMFVFFLVLTLIEAVIVIVTSGIAAAFALPYVLLAIHAAYEEIVGFD